MSRLSEIVWFKRLLVTFLNSEKFFAAFLQKLGITLSFFLRHELRNHAAAAAYYLLLSLIPMVLLLIYIFDNFLTNYPRFSEDLFLILEMFNANLNKETFDQLGISKKLGGAIGVFGALNLLWSSRLILLAIQRAFAVIFPSDKTRNFIWENAIAFIVLPVVFVTVLIIAVLNGAKEIILSYLNFYGFDIQYFDLFFSLITNAVPAVLAFIMVFMSYKFIPVKRPGTRSALKGSFLFLSVFIICRVGVMSIFDMITVNSAYGVVGSVILIMMWTYFVFVLYFFCAQYVFVGFKRDVLILDRLFSSEKPTDSFMMLNKKVLDKYTKMLRGGDILCFQGEESKEVYYLRRGRLKVVIGDKYIADINTGEVFGEMAHLTGENRTATVVADGDCDVIVLPPKVFDEILDDNTALSRRMMKVLCARLRKNG
jgi:membrane protein